MLQRIIVLGFVIFLSSCGFYLRGLEPDTTKVVKKVLVNNPKGLDVGFMVAQQAKEQGATLVSEKEEANVSITLSDAHFSQKHLSYATDGSVSQYRFVYKAFYVITKPKLVEDQRITVTRDMDFRDSQIIAKEAEVAVLKKGMAKELAQHILRRAYLLVER